MLMKFSSNAVKMQAQIKLLAERKTKEKQL